MKIRIISILFLFVALLGFSTGSATAQSYRFQVPEAEVNYFINSDGTASIEYTYTFINEPGAHAIEFVDIGMPSNSTYSYSMMSGTIDGHSISHIKSSEVISNGVEFGLGSYSIPAGQSGVFHALITNVRGVIYPGTAEEEEDYASTQFQPNYFDSSSVVGSTNLTVTIFLPPGMETTEPRYYEAQNFPGEAIPETGYDENGRVYYNWSSSDANSSKKYIFGAAFPARLIPASAIYEPPTTPGFIGSIMEAIFGNLACCGIGAFFAFVFGSSFYQATIGAKRRKMKYLPPQITIEGHGIKRGLTAVEAAILLEQPMDKILTMILFSVAKKGAAEVVTKEPLEIKLLNPLPENLRGYEQDFLEAFDDTKKSTRKKLLRELMIKLIKSVSKKMKGFSYKETVEYYKNIIEKAWTHVQSADTPEVKMQNLDEAMEWTILDKDYEDRSRRVFTGPVFVPIWWGRFNPAFRPISTGTGSAVSSSGGGLSLPHLPGSDFAASVVNGIQDFAANTIGDLTGFTSSVTNKTNPIPKSSSRSRSGGGCACACACAGCACACAGGGR